MWLVMSVVLAAGLCGTEAQVPTDPVAVPAYLYNATGAAAFAYNPTILTGNAATKATVTFAGAGLSQARTAAQLPAIQGSGLSQTYFEVRHLPLRLHRPHPENSAWHVHMSAATTCGGPLLGFGYKSVWIPPHSAGLPGQSLKGHSRSGCYSRLVVF